MEKEEIDEIIIDSKQKPVLEQEEVDEIIIEKKERPGLSEEPVDEISVSDKNKKIEKSTWASLDVQGSGFELLGKPIVSRLENQDVTKTQVGKRTTRLNKEKINTTQSKEENIISSVTTTEKSKRDLLNQKYKTISQNVTANINLQKRDDFNKNRVQKYTKYTTNKQFEDESVH